MEVTVVADGCVESAARVRRLEANVVERSVDASADIDWRAAGGLDLHTVLGIPVVMAETNHRRAVGQ